MRAVLADRPGAARSVALVGNPPGARRPVPLLSMSRARRLAHTRPGLAAYLRRRFSPDRDALMGAHRAKVEGRPRPDHDFCPAKSWTAVTRSCIALRSFRSLESSRSTPMTSPQTGPVLDFGPFRGSSRVCRLKQRHIRVNAMSPGLIETPQRATELRARPSAADLSGTHELAVRTNNCRTGIRNGEYRKRTTKER
jgi:hypothetical protein